MVDREVFDEWLRERAVAAGVKRLDAAFETLTRDTDGTAIVNYRTKANGKAATTGQVRAKSVVGADGALSLVARQTIKNAHRVPYVFAYHEIVRTPQAAGDARYDATRCDIYYQSGFSPDFYAWIFPHGDTASVGTGSANKGFSLRGAVGALRRSTGLDDMETVRREGAPIPLRPLKRWDNGRDIVLAGDAAGVVAPASGEGIYYAMTGGRLAAEAVDRFLATGDARALAGARKAFMKMHGRVFWILGIMQRFWYTSEWRRERFVTICKDRDVQRLTWESYMNKKLVRTRPVAHMRIFFKDLAHLFGLVSP
jgi:geranylgeranyl reductase